MNELTYDCDLCLPNTALSMLEAYYNTLETQNFEIDNDNNFIPFTLTFKYLGLLIDFLLDNSTNIKNRINSASKALGALSFIWNSNEVSLKTKIYI